MAFTAKILSWRFRHLNIVGSLLKRRPTKGGVTGTPGPPLATPLLWYDRWQNFLFDQGMLLLGALLSVCRVLVPKEVVGKQSHATCFSNSGY